VLKARVRDMQARRCGAPGVLGLQRALFYCGRECQTKDRNESWVRARHWRGVFGNVEASRWCCPAEAQSSTCHVNSLWQQRPFPTLKSLTVKFLTPVRSTGTGQQGGERG